MSVYKKLNEARSEFHKNKLQKGGRNQNKKYFEMEDFLPQALDAFYNVGLCGVVSFKLDEAKLTITDLDDDTFIEICSPFGSATLPNAHAIQNIGACQTFSRRYLWMAALEICEHDSLETITADVSSLDGRDVDLINACDTVEDLKVLFSELSKKHNKKLLQPHFTTAKEKLEQA